MRRLLCVPIVHSAADLGSVGAALERRGALHAGARRWALHQEAVDAFWAAVAAFLRTFDPARLKIYQDGLPAGGAVGRRIVEEAAARGSPNYRLLLELIEAGAELRETEDPLLLWQERENILRFVQLEPALGGGSAAGYYRSQRDRLMAQRDAFIALTIDRSLRAGEVGVLFIGADHNPMMHLSSDIAVEAAKDPGQVRAYLNALLFGQDDQELAELARQLRAPVEGAR